MDRATVKKELVGIITTIQKKSGYTCPEFTGETKPLKDVEQFCSKVAVLTTSKLAKKLEIDIPAKENIFIDKKTKAALTIDQIVAKVCKFPSMSAAQEAAA